MEFGPPPLRCFTGSMALLNLSALMGLIGAVLVMSNTSTDFELGVRWLAIGAAVLVAGLFWPVRRFSLRYALTVHEQGVLISHKGAEQAIPYSQVQGFSLREKVLNNNGRHGGTLRTLRFTWPGGSTRILHFAEGENEQAFGAVVAQLVGRFADAARARLGEGGSLQGKGWTLDGNGLSVKGQGPVRLGELAHVDVLEDKVSFWRSGEELPFFSVPAASLNGWLLGVMAQRQLSGRTRPTAGVLGRVLFEKGESTGRQVALSIAAGLCLLGAGWLLTLNLSEIGFLGPLFVAFFGGMALVFAHWAVARVRGYEHGVIKRSLLGTRRLRYSEVVSFQFFEVQHFLNGAHTGTQVHLSLTPGPGAKGIHFTHEVLGRDSDLELLREQVSGMVAARLLERLKRGEEVAWGPDARFTKGGLLLQASKLVGKGEPRLVPYHAQFRLSVVQGTCRLFIGNEAEAAASVECSVDNFHPGLKVLMALCSGGMGEPRIAV
jgi:hypothetical protein